MKKRILILLCAMALSPAVFASGSQNFFKLHIFDNDTREIKSLLNSQVRYANRTNFNKFIATYDKDYVNADGFNLETYSNLDKFVLFIGMQLDLIDRWNDRCLQGKIRQTSC